MTTRRCAGVAVRCAVVARLVNPSARPCVVQGGDLESRAELARCATGSRHGSNRGAGRGAEIFTDPAVALCVSDHNTQGARAGCHLHVKRGQRRIEALRDCNVDRIRRA